MEKDYAYYKIKLNEWGLPLDSRSTYTKSDWIIWTAAMAKSAEDFNALVDPLWKFYNETVDRVRCPTGSTLTSLNTAIS